MSFELRLLVFSCQFLLNEDSQTYKNQAELANSLQQELQVAQVSNQRNLFVSQCAELFYASF